MYLPEVGSLVHQQPVHQCPVLVVGVGVGIMGWFAIHTVGIDVASSSDGDKGAKNLLHLHNAGDVFYKFLS